MEDNLPRTEDGHGDDARQPEYGCRIALARIVLLTLLSYGFYAPYWTYVTWRHYRDHTDETAYPIWHALAQFVPIYGWFRFHAHVMAYKGLMAKQAMRNSLRIVPIMGIVVWVSLLGLVEGSIPSVSLAIALVRIFMAIIVLCWVQFNINRYWRGLESTQI